jgi:glycosyltransferase involved in cell wall biosynthesis
MPWHAVIVLRNLETVIHIRDIIPDNTPVWLWAHDLVDTRFLAYVHLLKKKNIGVIKVSEFHKKQLEDLRLLDPLIPELPLIKVIYNPIDDNLKPDDTPVNKTKLLFPSSSYKGLDNTIRVFKKLKEIQSDFELVITNPSYQETKIATPDGVHYLGSETHARNIQEMRSSLAVFQINHEVPETFGLVFAEANAVGTPCLAHPFGAAGEVLTNPDQLVNTYDREAVIQKILDWRFKERPSVDIPDKFRLSHVIQEWENLLF